jgi:glutamine amidotransferase-like uncharacterized protein
VLLTSLGVVLVAAALTACRAGGDTGGMPAHAKASILLFNGTGASPGDVAAIEKILASERLDYATADSPRVNRMGESQIAGYRLVIFPGGNFVKMGNSLTSGATANIRRAIRNGSNYLGICAGAFFAGNSPYNGLDLTSGVRFGFYAAEARGIHKVAVSITTIEGQTLDQYWEDDPQLTGWGAVVGKYPDGTPATVEGTFGQGWVILTGVHPEAPGNWRRGMDFRTPADVDNAYAARLIRAALNREWLPHY